MAEELSDLGIEHIGSGPDSSPISADPTELLAISKTMATDVQAVLLGYDVHFSYTKQFKAASYLLNKVGILTSNYRWRPNYRMRWLVLCIVGSVYEQNNIVKKCPCR